MFRAFAQAKLVLKDDLLTKITLSAGSVGSKSNQVRLPYASLPVKHVNLHIRINLPKVVPGVVDVERPVNRAGV